MRRHMARDMRSQKKMRTFAKGLMLQTFAANLRGFVLLIEVLVSVGDGLNGYECIALLEYGNHGFRCPPSLAVTRLGSAEPSGCLLRRRSPNHTDVSPCGGVRNWSAALTGSFSTTPRLAKDELHDLLLAKVGFGQVYIFLGHSFAYSQKYGQGARHWPAA